jgi:hypothetical protein
VAGSAGPLHNNPENQTFPLAVSIDAVPRKDKHGLADIPLNQVNIGGAVRFYMGSQQVKSAAWTSFTESSANAKYIQQAVDQSLGWQAPVPGFIPSIEAGDSINLNNGIVGQKELGEAPRLEALLGLDYIILPVIQGEPPPSLGIWCFPLKRGARSLQAWRAQISGGGLQRSPAA